MIVDPQVSKKKFIDHLYIDVEAGKGGNGSRAVIIQHNKKIHVGGNGGSGGSVIIKTSPSVMSLIRLNHSQLIAENGSNGSSGRTGSKGNDSIIKVPAGTLVYKIKENRMVFIKDLINDQQTLILAKGGKGGFGNK